MKLLIKNMNESHAKEILNWTYQPPYDFYNNECTDDSLKELLNGSYYAVVDPQNKLVGFYCIGESAQVPAGNQLGAYDNGFIDFGIGMQPEETGQGKGFDFCSFVLSNIQNKFKNITIRLTVANFNKRAIHLYENLGFVKRKEFITNNVPFTIMVKVNTF
ncbi:MAG: GNAT family N-acetyltransferase [Bacillus sp. (in: firmicutes)]